MKRNLFILLLFITCQSSCRKNKDVAFTGTITNMLTGNRLPNVEIKIDESYTKTWCIFGCTQDNTIGNILSDSNGSFSYSFSGKRKKEYIYKVHLNDVNPIIPLPQWITEVAYPNANYNYQITKDEGHEVIIPFNVVPAYFIRFRCNNVSPFDPNDSISVFYSNAYETKKIIAIRGTYIYSADFYTYKGNFTPVPASDQIFLRWSVKKNNFTTNYFDTIAAIPFDTLNYSINY
ncbi:MAG: hypothetical protein ABIS12_17870 [Bacteroidia bacterium]